MGRAGVEHGVAFRRVRFKESDCARFAPRLREAGTGEHFFLVFFCERLYAFVPRIIKVRVSGIAAILEPSTAASATTAFSGAFCHTALGTRD